MSKTPGELLAEMLCSTDPDERRKKKDEFVEASKQTLQAGAPDSKITVSFVEKPE